MNVADTLNLAVRHHQAGRLGEAEALYRRVLSLDPLSYQACYNLGNVLRDLGKRDEAVKFYRRGISISPNEPGCLNSLAGVLRRQGLPNEALELYRHAIRNNPGSYESHHNLGNAQFESGDIPAAVASFRRALELNPTSFATHQALIRALMGPGSWDEAIDAVKAAAAIWPNSAVAHDQLGVLLYADQRLDEAEAAYRTAIAADPNYFLAQNGMGHICQTTGRIDEAIACYDRALAIVPNNAVIASNRIFALQFKAGFEPAAMRTELDGWNARFVRPLAAGIRRHENSRDAARRLRIGYVSPDFREHVVGWNLLPLLSHHDRAQVEVFGYSGVEHPDATTEKLRGHADQWRSLLGLGDEQAAELIRDDRIDILVDLSLHSAGNRLLVFARKPAPVQISYLGYAGSTGLETMDYRLSDPYLDPVDSSLAFYSEKTLRLAKTYWCYQPGGPTPEPGEAPAKSSGKVTFGCLSNFSRVSPATLELWGRLLADEPGARMILYCPSERRQAAVRERFEKAGVAADRLEFLARQPWEGYVRTYQRIDVALDPIPFGGGITTCDSLWMGVPVITLGGRTAVARGACTVLANAGVGELIADSPQDYLRLARDWRRWIELRPSLRERMRGSALMDAAGFAREIEAAFRKAWTGYLSS